jgi:4-diphosphocytidyl-2-C-methyl-D-erythritol kinase
LPLEDFPFNERNLAARAARLFLEEYAPRFRGEIGIHVEKRIPIAAGLAGGSGDGAAVLLGLRRLLDDAADAADRASRGETIKTLMERASRLGADVPFCVMGQAALNPELGFSGDPMAATCALGEGIGDRLTPVPPLRGWVVLIKPPLSVSTARVYGALSLPVGGERPDTAELLEGLASKNYGKITKNMVNVLEIPALREYPNIVCTKQFLIKYARADKVLMSGSGPTVFAWYRDRGGCETAYRKSVGQEGDTRFMARLL